jgi:hypothetical protein
VTNTEMQLQKSFPMCTYTYTQTIYRKRNRQKFYANFLLIIDDQFCPLMILLSLYECHRCRSLPFSLSFSTFPVVYFLRLRFRLLHVYLFDRKTKFYDQVNNMTPNRFIFFILSDEKVFENLTFFQPNTVPFKVYGSSTNLWWIRLYMKILIMTLIGMPSLN